MESLYMVFDVESVGLHGPGFAVGWAVVDSSGYEHDRGFRWCHPLKIFGAHWSRIPADDDLRWVLRNCQFVNDKETPHPLNLASDLKAEFWSAWMRWKNEGALLAADVPWPVEAKFLADGIYERPNRTQYAPYPLIDIASVRLAVGLDPLGTEERLPGEKPAHNPLADARQSARLLVEALASPTKPQREGKDGE